MKLTIFLSMILISSFLYAQTEANQYGSLWLGAGFNNHYSLELGARYKYIGADYSVTFDSDEPPNVNDYECPHNDFRSLGDKRVDDTMGADILGFYDPTNWLAVYLGAGIFWNTYQEITQSNVTGWKYTEGEKRYEAKEAFSGGVHLICPNKPIFMGFGYHNIRGADIIIGVKF